MANVTINDNTKYVRLGSLCEGDYFILSGELYLISEIGFDGFSFCFNLSDREEKKEIDNDTRVFPVPSAKVKIEIDI